MNLAARRAIFTNYLYEETNRFASEIIDAIRTVLLLMPEPKVFKDHIERSEVPVRTSY